LAWRSQVDEAPKQGEDWKIIAQDFQTKVLPGVTHWQHGQFFAYFPAISTFESMLAELYAASVSNPGFNVSCPPRLRLTAADASSGSARRPALSWSR
jgi:hypothetical protein